MTCCIYMLYWNIDKPYIGQTINFNNRMIKHKSEIKTGTHKNYKILNEFHTYNTLPNIEILEECSSSELNTLEEVYIKEFDSINAGLNIISGGYSVGLGTNNPKSKYSREQLILAFNLLVDPRLGFNDIASITKINRSTINQIANGHQHIWLIEEFPEVYHTIALVRADRTKLVQTVEYKGTKYPPVLSPDGETVEINTSLDVFCKQQGLQNTNMYKLFKKKILQHKGWKLVN